MKTSPSFHIYGTPAVPGVPESGPDLNLLRNETSHFASP
jgi:hypothetical protein